METKTPSSAGKGVATVFCHVDGVKGLDFQPSCSSINGVHYISLLNHIQIVILEKYRGKNVLFIKKSVRWSTLAKSMDAYERNGIRNNKASPCSPDKASSDSFFWFQFKNIIYADTISGLSKKFWQQMEGRITRRAMVNSIID